MTALRAHMKRRARPRLARLSRKTARLSNGNCARQHQGYEQEYEKPSTVLHLQVALAVHAAGVCGRYGESPVQGQRGLADVFERSGRNALFSGAADQPWQRRTTQGGVDVSNRRTAA